MAKLSTILDQIDSGSMLLPEFQRGYVWNRDQVRGLMRSLYRGYPVGSFLIWETEPDASRIRGADGVAAGPKLLLLDGQQRITSLYGVARGRPPQFFEGEPSTFAGLYFNVDDETFEFYAPAKMKGDARWIDVTRLFVDGAQAVITSLNADSRTQPRVLDYMQRLLTLRGVLEREFHDEKLTGADKTIDVVVDVFNRVNSGGTKLSKGDLALAKICAESATARGDMRRRLDHWSARGYEFSLDWLLRNVNAVATGRAPFAALDGVSAADFDKALVATTKYVGGFLEDIAGRLGLDHDRVLMTRGGIPVVSRLLHLQGGHFTDARQRDRVLYWYVQCGIWGRFAGSTETVLAQDFDMAGNEGIDGLITALERWRGGNLMIDAQDFEAFGRGSRLYPILYLLTRILGARDFGSGMPLHGQMLSHLAQLQVHHIFPKAVLYDAGYSRGEVNAVANFCFLTQKTNLGIGKRFPREYLAEVTSRYPDVLESQWIPADPRLWEIDRYRDFLAARRELLANAANGLLGDLRRGGAVDVAPLERAHVAEDPDDRALLVRQLTTRLEAAGCMSASYDQEITDPRDGRVLSMAEAIWPAGLRAGLGDPVLLELDPLAHDDLARLEELGYKVFTDVAAMEGFVRRANDVASGELRDDVEVLLESEASAADEASVQHWPEGGDPNQALRAFGSAMSDVYRRARSEAGYNATIFLRMLSEQGPLETARRLITASQPSDGFTQLWERHRLDLTVEAQVLRPEFDALFTDEERDRCRSRLADYGYTRARQHGATEMRQPRSSGSQV